MLPAVKAKLLEGKKGLVVGLANENSIAWGCAKAFRRLKNGSSRTYVSNDKAKKYVEPLARTLESPIVMPLDVNKPGQMEAVFEQIAKEWGRPFVVHSIAFSPKEALCTDASSTCRAKKALRPRWMCPAGPSFAWRTWQTVDAQRRHAVHDVVLVMQMVVRTRTSWALQGRT